MLTISVTAAMRLRQLGTTQSITFFAPPEVDRSIRDLCGIPNAAAVVPVVTSHHVVRWLLEQTCRAHDSLRDLYLSQGVDFVRRTDAAWRYPDAVSNKAQRARLLAVLQQSETQTLEQLYGSRSRGTAAGGAPLLDPTPGPSAPPRLQTIVDQLQAVADGSNNSSSSSSSMKKGRRRWAGVQMDHALAEVEQERQVEVEVEEMRVVQKPPRLQALSFPGLHTAIRTFAHHGVLQDAVFNHAFAYLGGTGLGRQFGVRATTSRLFVSREFSRIVKLPPKKECDDGLLVSFVVVSISHVTFLRSKGGGKHKTESLQVG